jgi:hypothetical protein
MLIDRVSAIADFFQHAYFIGCQGRQWPGPVCTGHRMLAPTQATDIFPFDNSYARLPHRFFARLSPTPVSVPRLIRLNENLARQLGLDSDELSSSEGVAILAGNVVPKLGDPLAMAYAGHQFGNFVPHR